MSRFSTFITVLLTSAITIALTVTVSPWWLVAAVPLTALCAVGIVDVTQRHNNILRNYPILGHARFALLAIRPEIQQYFIERDHDGRPFDRDTRALIYARAGGTHEEQPFGTELDVSENEFEFVVHSLAPADLPAQPHRVRIGGPQCAHPYDMALLNVSAMSFGSLGKNAILALNGGAKRGGFAHDTGEGGLSRYHLEPGGDLVWEIGSGYFGCRNPDGTFDIAQFADKAATPSVKCISIKLSQGAKPGLGGVMPAAKMTAEIAEARGTPAHQKCVSPPRHSAFSTPTGLLEFVAQLRERSGGKPTGFKLCVGSRVEFLAICKAIHATGIMPDFIVVDGSEGGTGAAPLEFEDRVGRPLTEGLLIVRNALVGTGLKEHVAIGVSGKVATGFDIVKRIAQGADYTNSARAMMMALGCIQAQRCQTNTCPVGIATQDPKRERGLDVVDKAESVYRYQKATVESANHLIAALGLTSPTELRPSHLMTMVDSSHSRPFDRINDYLATNELLDGPPGDWAEDWRVASPDRFGHQPV